MFLHVFEMFSHVNTLAPECILCGNTSNSPTCSLLPTVFHYHSPLSLSLLVLGRVQRPNEAFVMGPQVSKQQQAVVDVHSMYLIDLII